MAHIANNFSGGPHPGASGDAFYKELWHACAGPLVTVPREGERVYYFPQGHMEQLEASTHQGLDQQLPSFNLPAKILCKVINVQLREAILVNCSRGPVVDEVALVNHLRENPMFRVGLDVFEEEPYMKPRLAEMKNAVVVPHIASASKWTREGMATLAALNVLGKIKGYPIWFDSNRVEPFLDEKSSPPAACPSIVNAKALALPVSKM